MATKVKVIGRTMHGECGKAISYSGSELTDAEINKMRRQITQIICGFTCNLRKINL